MTNPTALSPELAALRTAYTALRTLDADGRARALRWLFDALEVGGPDPSAGGGSAPAATRVARLAGPLGQ